MRLSVTLRRPGGVGQPPRQAAGHYGECPNWANALEQPPASLRGGLRGGPQISVRSLTSRKGALCPTGGLKMRFSVTSRPQNAPFRRVRFSLPGQTWRRLTEKRILTVRETADCVFPSRCGAREVWGNHPPGCGALWRMPQLGKCARATTRQPAGRLARGSADLGSESGLTEKCILRLRRDEKAQFALDAILTSHPNCVSVSRSSVCPG